MQVWLSTRARACGVILPVLTWFACASDARQDAPPTQTDVPAATAADASDASIGTRDTPDATMQDAGLSVLDAAPVVDAAPAVDASPPRVDCLTPDGGLACDDGVFCNGVERCEPTALDADARGCVRGAPLQCAAGQMCSEKMQLCSLCSDATLDDADGDGHEAASCGGDDCRDDDATAYPGAPELCNAKDDDCDGAIDGALAEAACVAAAPASASAVCAGSCQFTCNDPDADLVAGACVKHDDCTGVSSCGAGTCVDGVRSYTCSCPAGYRGTGSNACDDVDECASANDCDSSPAACVNTAGSHLCTCPSTHFGAGVGAHGCTRKAVAISAGAGSTCAVLSGGGVKCWGDNAFGKLGVSGTALGSAAGQMGDALPKLALDRAVVAVAAGSDVTCARFASGAAKCWGYNGYGALGGPGADGLGSFDAPLPANAKALAVGAGSGYGYALLDDGVLGRWGNAFTPYAHAPGTRQQSFDRSPKYDFYHLCAVLDGGAVSCWPGYTYYGDSSGYGTLGPAYYEGPLPETPPTIALGSGRTAKQVALGNEHSCALLDDGSVKCWGRNDYGQLGLGDTAHRGATAAQMGDALPTLALGGPAKAVAAGAHHSCALLESGVVKCWGLNDAGQLGQSNTDNQGDAAGELAALPAIALGAGRTAVAIDVGSHSCALLDNGGVKCWGQNASGELGQGDTLPRGAAAGTMGDALNEIDLGE